MIREEGGVYVEVGKVLMMSFNTLAAPIASPFPPFPFSFPPPHLSLLLSGTHMAE